ncbi:MAG: Lrp/AsnC family transcriptional regulator [Desulfobacterales bacterium]
MIDDVGLKILKILQEKARIPNVEVARQVGMAPSAVLERIRKLESQGYIDGYEVRLNPLRFRCQLVAFVWVEIESAADPDAAGAELSAVDEVQEVHYVSGRDGFLLKVRTSDPTQLDRILRRRIRRVPGVGSITTHIALTTHKETARIPIRDPGPS